MSTEVLIDPFDANKFKEKLKTVEAEILILRRDKDFLHQKVSTKQFSTRELLWFCFGSFLFGILLFWICKSGYEQQRYAVVKRLFTQCQMDRHLFKTEMMDWRKHYGNKTQNQELLRNLEGRWARYHEYGLDAIEQIEGEKNRAGYDISYLSWKIVTDKIIYTEDGISSPIGEPFNIEGGSSMYYYINNTLKHIFARTNGSPYYGYTVHSLEGGNLTTLVRTHYNNSYTMKFTKVVPVPLGSTAEDKISGFYFWLHSSREDALMSPHIRANFRPWEKKQKWYSVQLIDNSTIIEWFSGRNEPQTVQLDCLNRAKGDQDFNYSCFMEQSDYKDSDGSDRVLKKYNNEEIFTDFRFVKDTLTVCENITAPSMEAANCDLYLRVGEPIN